MKGFILLLMVAGYLSGCNNQAAKKAAVADQHFKDSIAHADGNKVLGNIRFGCNYDDFFEQKDAFKQQQKDTIYGYYIQDIKGKYTYDGQLYEVLFVGVDTADHTWDKLPFRDFLTEKFGMESESHNKWIVGDRIITIERERMRRSLYYMMRLTYRGITDTHDMNYQIDDQEEFDFYVMRFVSDSLRRESERQIKEKNIRAGQEYEQRQQHQEQKNRSDVESL